MKLKGLFFIFVLVLMAGCAYNPATVLDNYYKDLDVDGRFDQYYLEIQKGPAPFNTEAAIDALIDDLNTIDVNVEKARDIVTLTKRAATRLKDAAQNYEVGKVAVSLYMADDAYDIFRQALREKRTFMTEYNA